MLGVELVATKEDPEKHYQVVIKTDQFKLVKEEGSKLYFTLKTTPTAAAPHGLRLRALDSIITS